MLSIKTGHSSNFGKINSTSTGSSLAKGHQRGESLTRTNYSSNMFFMLNRRANHLLKDTCRSTLAHPGQPNHPPTKKAPTPFSEQADGGRGCGLVSDLFSRMVSKNLCSMATL